MATTDNGLAPKSYASTFTGPIGLNHFYHSGDLAELSGTKSSIQHKQNQEDCLVGQAVANDSHSFCDLSHGFSLKKIDVNSIKSRLATQPQCGDELLQE